MKLPMRRILLCGLALIMLQVGVATIFVNRAYADLSADEQRSLKSDTPWFVGNYNFTQCVTSLLSGDGNAEQVWNYLVGQMGMTAVQAAGIMGKLKKENSTFDPTVTNSAGAHGIAQWLGGRRTGLQQFAADRGTDENDLATQLDYLKQELETSYKAAVLDPIKASNDLSEVTYIWLHYYEVPCQAGADACWSKELDDRLGNAIDILTQYGSGTPSGSPSGGTGGCGASGNFSYGKYASMTRQQLIDLILSAPNWKPQSNNPVNDINSGVAVDNLLRLIAALLEALPGELITPSVIQTGHDCLSTSGNISNHMGGLAVDLGGAGHSVESMNNIFTWLYTNAAALGINELIFDPVPTGTSTLSHGKPFVYDASTRQEHQNHIHVSVEGPRPTSCPPGT